MGKYFFFKWVQNSSVSKKLYFVVGITALFITVELITLYFAFDQLSPITALVLHTIALTLGLSGLLLTFYIIREISSGLEELTRVSKNIVQRDYSAKAQVASNDEIGFLASALNTMSEELAHWVQKQQQAQKDLIFKTNLIQENEKRINVIMDALIKITQMDFSEKIEISDKGDELDAIAVGLNTMSEELEFHLNELIRSEEILNDAQRLAKIGNWEVDMLTNKVRWSNEMFNVYGYGNVRFDVTMEKAMERMAPEDVAKSITRMKINREKALAAFKEKGELEFQSAPMPFTILLPDGSSKVIQGISKLILNTNGEVIKMAGTVQDITEQDKAEKILNQKNIELKRKNKEIEQFAYAASHDLQEPLRSISNFSTLLAKKLEHNSSQEINSYMSRISGAANRMSSLIFDLLEYSRIGKDMAKSTTNCENLLKEVLSDLTVIIQESGATIHISQLPVINCYDIKSVFQNLILNAIKFKKHDTPPIITISASETENAHVFRVEDNGIGIEKQYYNRIFIIFQRLHTRVEYDGTGIGLSQCKKIVELHGGEIWVESEFGIGSTFYFTIPKNK